MSEVLAVFAGIHQTLSAEAALTSAGVVVSLVPTPPAITRGCGFSLLWAGAEEDAPGAPRWWKGLSTPGVLYRVTGGKEGRIYEEVDRRAGPGVPPAGDSLQKGAGGGRAG